MNSSNLAHDISWDLSDLYAHSKDPRILSDLDSALVRSVAFAERYRGRIASESLEATEILSAVRDLESIFETLGRVCVYAQLLHSADSTPAAHGALVATTQEKASAIRQNLIFFDLEWLAAKDDQVRSLLDDPVLRPYRHYLESLRRYRPHVLSEAEEKILEDKSNSGARAFSRLFDELLSGLTFHVEIDGQPQEMNESSVLALLYEPRREVRRNAAHSLTKGLEANQLTLGFILNTLALDHGSDDNLRHFSDPMQSRHLANEISHDTVEALMASSEKHHSEVQRYYRIKRQLLGLDELFDYDRYAPIAEDKTLIPWEDCRATVLSAYRDFSPRMAEIAGYFFENRWIDAALRPGKRGGAFSSSTVPSLHPYVLVNYSGSTHDVMTVAHELGHGVHQYLSRPNGYLQADTPLTTAETASIFGEMLVFDALLRQVENPQRRLSLLCHRIEDTIGTVFRQIAMTRFEQRVHHARRHDGELSRERLGDFWEEENRKLYGDSVTLTPDYRWWWSYIPHFIHTPFYCYAYAFGDLLVMALYAMYQREGQPFVERYLELLSAGGSESPAMLLKRIGVNIEDPGFWNLGLEPFDKMVREVERLAADA